MPIVWTAVAILVLWLLAAAMSRPMSPRERRDHEYFQIHERDRR